MSLLNVEAVFNLAKSYKLIRENDEFKDQFYEEEGLLMQFTKNLADS